MMALESSLLHQLQHLSRPIQLVIIKRVSNRSTTYLISVIRRLFIKNKLFKVRQVNRYAVIDQRTGNVQVVFARSQREANRQALINFRTGGIIANA